MTDERTGDGGRGRSRTVQVVTVALIAVAIVIGIFVFQNTQDATLTYLAWELTTPLSAALLLAVALGAAAGYLVAFVGQRRYVKALRRHPHGGEHGEHDAAA